MNKKELRKLYLQKRKRLPARRFQKMEAAIYSHFFLTFPTLENKHIHVFISISTLNEIDTQPLITRLSDQNILVTSCLSNSNNELQHRVIDANSKFIPNKLGVPEPVEGQIVSAKVLDLVLVPLLIFDLSGYRVGYGKGYYDRFLKQCKPSTAKVGLSLFDPVKTITDRDQLDVPLNYCITPASVYKF